MERIYHWLLGFAVVAAIAGWLTVVRMMRSTGWRSMRDLQEQCAAAIEKADKFERAAVDATNRNAELRVRCNRLIADLETMTARYQAQLEVNRVSAESVGRLTAQVSELKDKIDLYYQALVKLQAANGTDITPPGTTPTTT